MKKQRKRGVSGVVTVVILIALVIAMAAVVWTVVDKLVKGKLESAQSCMDIYDKVTLNRVYTCYSEQDGVCEEGEGRGVDCSTYKTASECSTDSEEEPLCVWNSASDINELHVSINIGDIEVEELVVSIAGKGETKSFKIPIKSGSEASMFVKKLGDEDYGGDVNLPGKNAGRTYVVLTYSMIVDEYENGEEGGMGFLGMPDSVSIAPVIDGEQCRVVDSIAGFDRCEV